MKIGFFTDGYLPQKNGVATTVAGFAKALQKRGHEVYIIAPKYPGYKDTERHVIRLTSIDVKQETDVRVAIYLPEKALRETLKIDFDIVHGHSGGSISLLGWEVARRKNIPYVFTYHTLWSKYTHYFLKGLIVSPKMMETASRIFCNASDGIIAPSLRVKNELNSYGIKKPIFIVPNGLNISDFQKNKDNYLRKKCKIKKENSIILYVGRIAKEKSIGHLIQGFSIVHKKVPNTSFVLVGEGPELHNLQKLAKDLEIEKDVHFVGGVNYQSIPKAFKSADVFAFASKTETQGMVVIEALTAGLPTVTVNAAPFKNLITNNHDGLLVKYTPQDFAEKIIQILTDKKLREKLSINAQKTAKNFSLESLTPQLENVYNYVIEKNKNEKKKGLKEKISLLKNYLYFVYKE